MMKISILEMPIFSFQDNNLSKCQGILTKLDTCIDIKEIWFGIANGQISSIFDREKMAGYYRFTFLFLCSPKNFGGAYSRRFVRASVCPCVRPALVHANSRKLLVGFQ